MTALNPHVHHTVTPTSDTHAHGVAVTHGVSDGRPTSPSRWLTKPRFASSRNRHSRPMTATPSTYGAKYTARKNVRPGNERFSSSAIASGSTTSSGTDSTVKIAVARTLSHQSLNTSESLWNSSL